jgi:hypothetical protein
VRNRASQAMVAYLMWTASSAAVGCSPGTPSHDGTNQDQPLDCRATNTRASAIDGCLCQPHDDWSPDSADLPRVEHCDSSYAGDLTLCCRSSSECLCTYAGCRDNPSQDICWCGFDLGGARDPTDTAVSTCTAARCCANRLYAYCDCDSLTVLECGTIEGEEPVTSCTATTVPARCPSGYSAVSACDGSQ